MNEVSLINKLEQELLLIQEECRVRGRGISAFQERSLGRLEAATGELEGLNPRHPDVQSFDELLGVLEGEVDYDPELFKEVKMAQTEDERMLRELRKHITLYRKADGVREKALKKIIQMMRDYQLRIS